MNLAASILAASLCIAPIATAALAAADPAAPAAALGGSGRLVLLSDGGPRAGPGLRLAAVPAGSADAVPLVDPALEGLIDAVAQMYGHDPQLLRAIVRVESGFNPMAISPKGAIGLMQVMPATAQRMGLRDVQKLFDPAVNLHAGARYLRLLIDMFPGRLDLAVAAYNSGEGAVIRHSNSVPPYTETQAYVQRVMGIYGGGRRSVR